MTIVRKFILFLLFNFIIVLATAQVAVTNKSLQVDTLQTKLHTDSLKVIKKTTKRQYPEFYYFGLDLMAPILFVNTKSNYKQLTIFAETRFKKNIWATAMISGDNAVFAGSKLNYKSNTGSATFGLSQTFFPDNFKNDLDNAFAGLGYGLGYCRTSEATFVYEDIWGKQEGVISPNTSLAHWIEFTTGFRFHILPKIQLGWRVQGKALLNPTTFERNIAPIHIANYGSGDKASAFGYQLLIAYRWHN
jgi:hypothetical protein